MSTHNLCFEQKYEKYLSFLSEKVQFLEMKFSIYLNRHVFVMYNLNICGCQFQHRQLGYRSSRTFIQTNKHTWISITETREYSKCDILQGYTRKLRNGTAVDGFGYFSICLL